MPRTVLIASLYYFICSSLQHYKVDTILIPIVQMRQLRFREIKSLSQHSLTGEQQSQNLNAAVHPGSYNLMLSFAPCWSEPSYLATSSYKRDWEMQLKLRGSGTIEVETRFAGQWAVATSSPPTLAFFHVVKIQKLGNAQPSHPT